MIASLVPPTPVLRESLSSWTVEADSCFARGWLTGQAIDDAVGPAFIEALQKAKARPATLRVDNEQLAATLRSACEAIGVPLMKARLTVAPSASQEFEAFIQTQNPR